MGCISRTTTVHNVSTAKQCKIDSNEMGCDGKKTNTPQPAGPLDSHEGSCANVGERLTRLDLHSSTITTAGLTFRTSCNKKYRHTKPHIDKMRGK
jgi:hypothetical protein